MTIARRTFLSAAGAGALASGMLPWPGVARAAAPEDFATLRQRVRDVLTGGDFDPDHPMIARYVADLNEWADSLTAKIVRGPGRDRVFDDLPYDIANMRTTYDRLRDLALTCATPGLARHGDPSTEADILAGLRTTHDRIYHAGADTPGNWWFWEIGAPRPLLWTCILIGDALPAADRADYVAAVRYNVPDPTRHKLQNGIPSVGANRSDLCEIAVLDGMLDETEDRILSGRSALADLLPRTTQGDGFYADGSFVQHGYFAYTGSYGVVLLGGMARQFEMLTGTPWAITDPRREDFLRVVDESYAPVIHDGKMMDFVRGRAVSLQLETDRIAGYTTMEHILRLARAAGDEQAARWKGLVKGWVTRDAAEPSPPVSPRWGMGPARVSMLAQVLDDPAVPPAPERREHRQFPAMDRAVHRRPSWTWAISMSSRRISYYEGILAQNKHGWHTGSGMTYLYDADAGQFTDAFWPTVDPYRLPGTTVDTTPLDVAVGSGVRPDTSWVGGVVSKDGVSGVVGMELQGIVAPRASQVRGRKAWFCLPDRVVALGAGITGGGTLAPGRNLARGDANRDGTRYPVVTTVENRNLHATGTNELIVDGRSQPSSPGWSTEFAGAGWAHLAGVGGYVFPGGTTLLATREERTAAWRDIDSGTAPGTTDPVTRRYLTLSVDHGIEPRDERYSYIVLPGSSARRTARIAADPGVEVVANSAAIQAVRTPGHDRVMAAFFGPGSVAGVTVDAPVAVIVERFGETLAVSVADPTRSPGPVRITIDRRTTRVLRHDPELDVAAGPATTLTATLSGATGGTRSASFLAV